MGNVNQIEFSHFSFTYPDAGGETGAGDLCQAGSGLREKSELQPEDEPACGFKDNLETHLTVLHDINLQVKEGEFLLLTGPSGCGKTTFLRQMKKSLVPYGLRSGSVTFRGTEITELDDRTAVDSIGYVFQDPESQIVTDKVWHEMAFGLENLGVPRNQMERRIGEMANFFGITDWFLRPTDSLSGGEKQILNLASVLLMNPEVLLLDEPTSQLDPLAADRFLNYLRKVHEELGITVILSEHRLEGAFPLADRVLRMRDGRIAKIGTPRELAGLCGIHDLDFPAASRIGAAIQIRQGRKSEKAAEETDPSPISIREGRDALRLFHEAVLLPEGRNDCGTEEKESADSTLTLMVRGDDRDAAVQSPAGESPKPVIQTQGLYFRYERENPWILRDLSVSLYPGEFLCLIGGNGSGKSTLLSVLAGSLRPQRGKMTAFGQKVRSEKDLLRGRDGLVLLPQDPKALFHGITAEEEFQEMLPAPTSAEEEEIEKHQIAGMLEKLGLQGAAKRHPYDLSGGEEERLALGKLLLLQPHVLLLDEPTKGLDPYAKAELLKLLKRLRAEGTSILCVTHDLEFAASSDRVAMLFDGHLTEADAPEAFFRGNRFYTTAAERISRGFPVEGVTTEEVIHNILSQADAGSVGIVPDGLLKSQKEERKQRRL